jgi:hypothetical protein
MSDLKTQPGVPIIRMDHIDEMDIAEDYNAPVISDVNHKTQHTKHDSHNISKSPRETLPITQLM